MDRHGGFKRTFFQLGFLFLGLNHEERTYFPPWQLTFVHLSLVCSERHSSEIQNYTWPTTEKQKNTIEDDHRTTKRKTEAGHKLKNQKEQQKTRTR